MTGSIPAFHMTLILHTLDSTADTSVSELFPGSQSTCASASVVLILHIYTTSASQQKTHRAVCSASTGHTDTAAVTSAHCRHQLTSAASLSASQRCMERSAVHLPATTACLNSFKQIWKRCRTTTTAILRFIAIRPPSTSVSLTDLLTYLVSRIYVSHARTTLTLYARCLLRLNRLGNVQMWHILSRKKHRQSVE